MSRLLRSAALALLLAGLGCNEPKPAPAPVVSAPPVPASAAPPAPTASALPAAGSSELPAGEERAEFDRLCLTCHTAKYVVDQPLLAKKVWEKSMDKHVHEYGAPLTQEESARILAYLLTFKEAR